MFVLYILILVAFFGLTIFVHELGHFLSAISLGMVVDVFSIGFGPAIWKKKIRGILFKVCWIPFGGYVAIPQLDPAAMSTIQEGGDKDPKRILPPVAPWKKIIVAVAGATGNLLLAILIAWVIFLSPSAIVEGGNTTIGLVEEESEAFHAGIRAGDEIVKVNGNNVYTWNEYLVECILSAKNLEKIQLDLKSSDVLYTVELPVLTNEDGLRQISGISKQSPCIVHAVGKGTPAEAAGVKAGDLVLSVGGQKVLNDKHLIKLVAENGSEPVKLVVARNSKEINLEVIPEWSEEYERHLMGIRFGELMTWPWMQYKRPMEQIKSDSYQVIRMLKALVTPKEAGVAAKGLGGPPKILMMLYFSIKLGLLNALGFVRMLNINLMLLNMLPLPVLDGGHVVFALWQWVTKREPHPRLVSALVNTFAVLLIALMLLLSMRDIFDIPRWFGKIKERSEVVENDVPPQADEPAEE